MRTANFEIRARISCTARVGVTVDGAVGRGSHRRHRTQLPADTVYIPYTLPVGI